MSETAPSAGKGGGVSCIIRREHSQEVQEEGRNEKGKFKMKASLLPVEQAF